MSNSDWEIVQENAAPQSDWEMVPHEPISRQPQPQESLKASFAKAPFRAWEDLSRAGMGFLKDIPSYYEKAKTEIPGLVPTIMHHPGHALSQAAAGSQELINQLAQLPLGVAKYGANRLNLLPQNVPNAIEKITPEDTTEATNKLFGQPQYPGEALIRGTVRNLADIGAPTALAAKLNPLKLTAKNITKDVLNTKNKMLEKYSGENGLYTKLFNDARQNGLGEIDYKPSNKDLNAIEEFANPKFTENLRRFMNSGDIEDAHWAQSDLNKFVRKNSKRTNIPAPEQKAIGAAQDIADKIKSEMFKPKENVFETKNNLSNLFRKPENFKNRYQEVNKGYRQEVIPYTQNPSILKYLNKDVDAPTLVKKLTEGPFSVKRGEFHPQLKWRKRVIPIAATAGGTALAAKLYDALLGHQGHESSNEGNY